MTGFSVQANREPWFVFILLMAPSPQNRAYVFTINNPVENVPSDNPLEVLKPLEDKIKYAVWQLEKGENGTPHYQGYIQWKGRGRRLQGMKALLPRAHFEVAKGSSVQNKSYCTKEEGRVEGPFYVSLSMIPWNN